MFCFDEYFCLHKAAFTAHAYVLQFIYTLVRCLNASCADADGRTGDASAV